MADSRSPAPPDDDPTHALDDFVRRLRPAPGRANEAPPDLSDLVARLQPAPPPPPPDAPPPRPAGGRLRSGQTWRADEVEDVEDVAAVVTQQASAQWQADDDAAAQPVWQPGRQPDGHALQTAPASAARLLPLWQPGAWVGALRPVLPGRTALISTPQGPVVESHPALALLVLWPPTAGAARPPGRWPERAVLVPVDEHAPPSPRAGAEPGALLAQLPDEATLWLLPDATDAADWALAAELVLLHEAGLRPPDIDGLRAFMAAQRDATFARLNDAYQRSTPAGGAALKPPR
jgi:hypothetical protein